MPIKKNSHPEARGLITLLACFLTLLATFSFDTTNAAANWLGTIGHAAAWILAYLFGVLTYPLLGIAIYIGWKLIVEGKFPFTRSKVIYLALFLVSLGIILSLCAEQGMPPPGALKHKIISETLELELPYYHHTVRHNLGGVPLYFLYRDIPLMNLQLLLSNVGVAITFSLTATVFLILATNIQLSTVLQSLPITPKKTDNKLDAETETIKQLVPKPLPTEPMKPSPLPEQPQLRIRTLQEREEKVGDSVSSKKMATLSNTKDLSAYQLPQPALLNHPKKVDQPSLKKELKRQAEILEETLMSFGIEAKVGDINCGPTIISFEVHPAVGVKVQKITTLANDIALNLQAKSIRIIAPIPGKAAVGVEIPSPYPQEVSFKEMLLSYQQSTRKMQIPILLGKTVTGDNVISDLAKMPHCLIAGATGSGKSVCINTLVMSIVMNARPDEVKFVMVDPKKVELTSYANLPHMIAPVITEPHGAYAALNWLVKEMQLRYDILKQLGLRNISAFNERKINTELESSLSIPIPDRMPAIVAIIDEFADLMMASSADLETPIARIAQMARAVGIHLVLATQRPSREVITGLIKANFPTRIAFKVASRVNSQIIIDDNGAESLLGNGDLLFLPPGSSHLMRAQGAYISDEEINRVLQFICNQAQPNYLIQSFDALSKEAADNLEENGPRDALYAQAKEIVLQTRNASTTFLQRKLKIGYARAASLMDELEASGVIGAQEGSKSRRILLEDFHCDREEKY